jgi:phosphatidylglycerol lysyltransferase
MSDGAGGAVRAMILRRRQRRAAVLTVLLASLTNLGAAVFPGASSHLVRIEVDVPLAVNQGSRALLLASGVLLLVLARGLRKGYRRAWLAAFLIIIGSALLHIAHGRGFVSVVVSAALATTLVVNSEAFEIRTRRPAWGAMLAVPLVAAVGVGFGLVRWHAEGLPDVSVAHRLTVVLRSVAALHPGLDGLSDAARSYLDSLAVFGVVVVLLLLVVLLRPVLEWRSHAHGPALENLLCRRGQSSTAPLAALPGNEVVALAGGHAVVGFAESASVAVAVGTPISEPGFEVAALAEYTDLCERNGWLPTLLAVDAAGAERGRSLGYEALKIGEEAFVDLCSFDTGGSARAKVRRAVARAERGGVRVHRYDDDVRTPERDRELKAISDAWLAGKHIPEMGFTLGRFEPARLGAQHVYVAVAGERVQGFVTWLPFLDRRAAVLDLMRRAPGSVLGTMDALLVRSMEDLRANGYELVSLSAVPFATTTERNGPLEQALGWVYEHGNPVYEPAGLFRFKDKFAPRWEPIYLLYPTNADLPRVSLAIARAFAPTGLAALARALIRRK